MQGQDDYEVWVTSDSDQEQYENQAAISLPFSNLTSRKEVRTRKSTSGLAYRWVFDGLNMKGMCKTKDCQAENKPTWVRKGYGSFDIGEIKCQCICPCCKKKLKSSTVTTFGYMNAEVLIKGVKLIGEGDDQQEQFFQLPDTAPQKHLVRFLGDKDDIVHWAYIKIEVKQLK